jgi:general stress protein YciG
MDKAEAGRKGGKATYKKHGSGHMSRIGSKGGRSTWSRYKIVPIGVNRYAMVERKTNQIIAMY